MIRMLGIIEDIPTGMNKSVYDEAIKKVESSLGLSEYGPRDLPPREVPTGFSAAKWRAKRPSSMPSQSPPPKRKPGDIWQTRQGWGAMNKDGQTKYFNGDPKEEKFDAEDFAKGTGNYSPERLSAINLAGSPKTEARPIINNIDESGASDEAKKLGLDYLRFGRWGKDGKVTHITKNGKLVPFTNNTPSSVKTTNNKPIGKNKVQTPQQDRNKQSDGTEWIGKKVKTNSVVNRKNANKVGTVYSVSWDDDERSGEEDEDGFPPRGLVLHIKYDGNSKNPMDDVESSFVDETEPINDNINARQTIESLIRSPRLKKMVNEEYKKLLEDCEKEAPKIEKKLEDMRSKMCEDFMKLERKGTFTEEAGEKRIQVNTVAELIDVPVNELMLYFLNSVKVSNERKLVEYRLGHVYFYASKAE